MTDVIITLSVLFFTAALICIIRLLTANKYRGCRGPRAKITVYYDVGCECLEYTLGRIIRDPAFGGFNTEIKVVDKIGTSQSRAWLEQLRKKLKTDFEIISEDKSDRAGDGND